jgi:benzodiazapine receptor
MTHVARLIVWGGVTFAAAAIGAFASSSAPEFYGALAKPSWAPAVSLFGPVWTALYAMMAVAAWRVSHAGGPRAPQALGLYVIQLVVNAAWSWLFFRLHSGAAAMADIVLLVVLIVATMMAFARVSRLAAFLLAPYLAWVLFATALTWSLWRANPSLL